MLAKALGMTRKKEAGSRVRRLMIRAKPQTGYAILGRKFLQDQRLVGDAGWLASYLLSQVEHWEVRVPAIAEFTGWSRDRVYRALKILVQCGYAARRKTKGEDGLFDGVEYVVCDDPNEIAIVCQQWRDEGTPALDEAPEESTPSPCPDLPDTAEPYTAAADDIDNIDTQKLPPKSPPGRVAGSASGETQAPSPAEPPSSDSGKATNPSSAAPGSTTEGSAGKGNSDPPLAPVTLRDVKRQWEPYNARKLAKADEAWDELSVDQQVHCAAVLPQYFAHMARVSKKPIELWKFIRLGVFRQYPPPRKPGDLPPPKELPPDPDAVLATELGLRAAEERWALDLVEFVQKHRRVPDPSEADDLARAGRLRHRELVDQDRAIAEGRMVGGPMVPVLLAKRRNVIAKALRLHGRSPPEEGGSDPPARPAWPAEREPETIEL